MTLYEYEEDSPGKDVQDHLLESQLSNSVASTPASQYVPSSNLSRNRHLTVRSPEVAQNYEGVENQPVQLPLDLFNPQLGFGNDVVPQIQPQGNEFNDFNGFMPFPAEFGFNPESAVSPQTQGAFSPTSWDVVSTPSSFNDNWPVDNG